MVNDRQSLDLTTFARPSGDGEVEWRIAPGPVPYPDAVAAMESRVAAIAAQTAPELVWLLEHPPLYTSGTSGKVGDLLDLAVAGVGLVGLGDFLGEAALSDGQLVPLLTQCHDPDAQPIAALILPGRQTIPRVRAFVDFLKSSF